MKYLIIAVIAIIALFMIFRLFMGGFPSNYSEQAFYVDVRTPSEFAGGSVPNAINIPLDQLESSLSQFENKEQIVVFCRSGNRSGKAKAILEKNGFDNVVNGGPWKNVAKNLANK